MESSTPSASTEAENQLCSRKMAVVEEHLEELLLVSSAVQPVPST